MGLPLPKAVLFGVVAGAATIMTPGTELGHRQDVERLFARGRLHRCDGFGRGPPRMDRVARCAVRSGRVSG
jgi:hypothetical protein